MDLKDAPKWTDVNSAWTITLGLWREQLPPHPNGENFTAAKNLFIEKINENNWPDFIIALSEFVEVQKYQERKFAGLLYTFIQKRWKDVPPPATYVPPPPKPNKFDLPKRNFTIDKDIYIKATPLLQFKMALRAKLYESNYTDWYPELSPEEEKERNKILQMSDIEWTEECNKMDLEIKNIRTSK